MMKLFLLTLGLLNTLILVQGFHEECSLVDEFEFKGNASNHQCMSQNSREPRFLNFRQYKDSVQMEVDLAVPFLSIPVNKSLSGLLPMEGLGQLRFNLPSLIMTGVVALSGGLLGSLNKMFANRWNTTLLLQKFMNKRDQRTEDFKMPDLNKFGEEFRKYRERRSERKREPRFINLRQYANSVQIELDFVIPFLSIPVNKSVRSFTDFMQQGVVNGIPPIRQGGFLSELQINYPAFFMGIFVIIGGALLGALNKITKNGLFLNPSLGKNKKQRSNQSYIWIMNLIDKALQKYKLDSRICSQKAICWYVRESKLSIQKNKGNKFEKFVDGLTSASWALEMIAKTEFEKGVEAGKNFKNCDELFENCRLTESSFETFRNMVF